MKYRNVHLPFGFYLPDQPFLGGGGLEAAHQVVYMDGAYQRVPGRTSVSGALAIADKLNNALWAHDESGTRLYAATSGHLLEINTGTGVVTDRCKGGHYVAGDWSLLKFGDNVIAANASNPLQTIAPAAAAIDLATSTTKPQGKYLCACRGHVILANISQPAAKPREFRWSGRFDPTNWEPGTNRSGFGELFTDAGIITGCAGFEDFWLIFTSTGVFRASYIGGDAVWSLQQIGHSHDGMPRGMFRSVIQVGRDAYYISRTGPKVVLNGEAVADIAAGMVRRSMMDFSRCALTDAGYPLGYIPFADSQAIVSGMADSLRRVVAWSWIWLLDFDYYLVTWIYSIDEKAWSTMAAGPTTGGASYNSMLIPREYGASLVAGVSGPLRGASVVSTSGNGLSMKLEHFNDDSTNVGATLISKLLEVGPSSTALHAVRLRARYTSSLAPAVTVTVNGFTNLPTDPSEAPDVTATLSSSAGITDERGFMFVPGGPLRAAYLSFKVSLASGGAQVRDLVGLDLLLDPDKSER